VIVVGGGWMASSGVAVAVAPDPPAAEAPFGKLAGDDPPTVAVPLGDDPPVVSEEALESDVGVLVIEVGVDELEPVAWSVPD
jgi:hypothetical protein